MVHMHTAQLASAQLLQHRGHFEFMNYFVVFGTTGRMGLISSKERREGASVIFFFSFLFCEEVGAQRGKGASSLLFCEGERGVCLMSGSWRARTAGLRKIKQASSADKRASQPGREKNTGGEGIQESKRAALCSLSNWRELLNNKWQ